MRHICQRRQRLFAFSTSIVQREFNVPGIETRMYYWPEVLYLWNKPILPAEEFSAHLENRLDTPEIEKIVNL